MQDTREDGEDTYAYDDRMRYQARKAKAAAFAKEKQMAQQAKRANWDAAAAPENNKEIDLWYSAPPLATDNSFRSRTRSRARSRARSRTRTRARSKSRSRSRSRSRTRSGGRK